MSMSYLMYVYVILGICSLKSNLVSLSLSLSLFSSTASKLLSKHMSVIIRQYMCYNLDMRRPGPPTEFVGPRAKGNLAPPPPILQIMILKLSPPQCVISNESVQQKRIDEL